MDERFRPQYHYTAEKNMINDPNGLVYYDGEYHLFHQYNAHEVVHWGHAISTDLVHWTHLPPAIHPDFNGQVYSGTAVVDHDNTSGLRTGAEAVFVALFTHANHADGTQSQGLAYSNDRGRTWTMHQANPILPNPGCKDFRDPKVFRHKASDSWIMVVTAGDHLRFHRSPNLIDWTYTSSWGSGEGAHGGAWECPDLFELPIRGSDETRWVLSVSVERGAPAGGSGMQYFIGAFDGQTFVNDNSADTVLWQNWGKDYYAGITWENVPDSDGRRLMIAWADNWLYRFDIPTTPFNGQLTVVRELELHRFPEGLRMVARPVRELGNLRVRQREWGHQVVTSQRMTPVEIGDAYEVFVEFDADRSTAAEYGIEVRVGDGEATRIGFRPDRAVAYIDRTRSGLDPHPDFLGRHEAPTGLVNGRVRLRVLVDRSSVEVFVNDREQLTDLVLPAASSTGFRPFADGGEAVITDLKTSALAPIWERHPDPIDKIVDGQWAATSLGIQGSATGRGIALVEPGNSEDLEVIVELVGTRDGNPGWMLGERAAGIVLDFNPRTPAAGTAVLLDNASQRLSIQDLSTGTTTSIEHPIETNRRFLLRLHRSGSDLTVAVDGYTVLTATIDAPATAGKRIGLLVHDAEAIFVLGN